MNALSLILGFVLLMWAAPSAANSRHQDGMDSDQRLLVAQQTFQPVFWQQDRGEGPRRAPRRRNAPIPPGLRERLRTMPPGERERVLENNRRFQQLPPERQEELRERLRQLQEMTPEQRELLEQRFAIFNNLTPRQQQKARQIYERRWRRLPPERRRALLQEFRHLRDMSAAEQRERLSSEDLQSHFSPEERDLLQQLIEL